MSKLPLEYLRHIFDETEYILNQTSHLSKEEFHSNETLKRAFSRSLEIIGEASKNIDANFRSKYSEINWKVLARMRDKLIHHYFGIDYSIVWDVVKNEIPILKVKIQNIIEENKKTN